MNDNKQSIIILGVGGHAVACIDAIEQEGRFSVFGIIGKLGGDGSAVLNYSVIGSDEDLPGFFNKVPNALIAIGQILTPDPRIKLYNALKKLGFNTPAIISPQAYVSPHAEIGSGSIIMHGAVVNAGAKIGENCIINSRALIEHGVCVANHCHVSTGVILNGDVRVGEGTFIGSGSVIKESISLGMRCIIGMGLSIRHDQLDMTKVISRN